MLIVPTRGFFGPRIERFRDYTYKNKNIRFATYDNGVMDNSGKNNEHRLVLMNGVILPDFIDLDLKKVI